LCKVWLASVERRRCSNEAKTRKPLKLAGVPQINETISAASMPKFTILWEHVKDIFLLHTFFPIVDTCLSCEDIARQSCAMCPDGDFLAIFYVLYFQRAACSTFWTCILNSHKGHTMCGKVWQTSNLRRLRLGEEKRKKKKEERNHRAKI